MINKKIKRNLLIGFSVLTLSSLITTIPLFVIKNNNQYNTNKNLLNKKASTYATTRIDLDPASVNVNYGNTLANNYTSSLALGVNENVSRNGTFVLGFDGSDSSVWAKARTTDSYSASQNSSFTQYNVIDTDWYDYYQTDANFYADLGNQVFIKAHDNNGSVSSTLYGSNLRTMNYFGYQFDTWIETTNSGSNTYDIKGNFGTNNALYTDFFKNSTTKPTTINQTTPYVTVGVKLTNDPSNARSNFIRAGNGINPTSWNATDVTQINGLSSYSGTTTSGYSVNAGVMTYARESDGSIDVYSGSTDIKATTIDLGSYQPSNDNLNSLASEFLTNNKTAIQNNLNINMVNGFPGSKYGDTQLYLTADDASGSIIINFKPGSILSKGGVCDNQYTYQHVLLSGFKVTNATTTVAKSSISAVGTNLASYSPWEIADTFSKNQLSPVEEFIYDRKNEIFSNPAQGDGNKDNYASVDTSGSNVYGRVNSTTSTSITFEFTLRRYFVNGSLIDNWYPIGDSNHKTFTITITDLANKDTKLRNTIYDVVTTNDVNSEIVGIDPSQFVGTSSSNNPTYYDKLKTYIKNKFFDIFENYSSSQIMDNKYDLTITASNDPRIINLRINLQDAYVNGQLVTSSTSFDVQFKFKNSVIKNTNISSTKNSSISNKAPSQITDDELVQYIINNKNTIFDLNQVDLPQNFDTTLKISNKTATANSITFTLTYNCYEWGKEVQKSITISIDNLGFAKNYDFVIIIGTILGALALVLLIIFILAINKYKKQRGITITDFSI